jgi:hypothetical protein
VLLYDGSVRPGFVAQEVARRYVRASWGNAGGGDDDVVAWRDEVRVDKSIFLGTSGVEARGRMERL